MLTDRFTARVLGAVVLIMAVLIDVSCFIFTKPEIRSRTTFPLVVLVPSLPLFAFSFWLFRRSAQLKDDGD